MNNFDFKSAKKYNNSGVSRVVAPQITKRRVTPLLEEFGVTRISDITQLDFIGIPTFISVRPKDKGPGISYYNGKGTTKIDSHVGAIMEALERYCGESYEKESIFESYNKLKVKVSTVNPEFLIIPTLIEYDNNRPIEWVLGYDLINQQSTYVPLNVVVCPYSPSQGEAVFYASTNGLASGNCMEEAVCHALCEVVERDCSSISQSRLELLPAISNVLKDLNLNSEYKETSTFPLIDQTKIPLKSARLIGKLKRAGMKVYLRDVTSDVGIPTIDATIVEEKNVAHGGTGSHPDARIALSRAITEAAQSRLAHLHGGREDLTDIVRDVRPIENPRVRFGKGDEVQFSSIKSYEHQFIKEDIEFILNNLKKAGFSQAIAVDMTKPSLKIPVVRIIIPHAETWSVFSFHIKKAVFGKRLRKMFCQII